jgi:hypothetical protein
MATRMNFKNTFGSSVNAGGVDLQRTDLWKVTLILPAAVGIKWTDEVEFALEKFPFPERAREMIEVKYMQQTNFLIGKDMPTPAIEVPIRYAFQALTAEALEKWYYLVSNPQTGGVGLTSSLKAKGLMRWMVPDMNRQTQDLTRGAVATEQTLGEGLSYVLEGCIIKGLRFTDADMTQSGYVNLLFGLQIDRYYPADINAMNVTVSV